MRSPMTLTMGFAVGLALGFSLHAPRTAAPSAAEAMDAASRDGAYLARLDLASGRKPRLAIGRWSTSGDRALFIAGYEEGYEQVMLTRDSGRPKADSAEMEAYRQGLSDGAADQSASQPFRPGKANHDFQNVAQSLTQGSEVSARGSEELRAAYLNGYEHAYYSDQKATLWSYYGR